MPETHKEFDAAAGDPHSGQLLAQHPVVNWLYRLLQHGRNDDLHTFDWFKFGARVQSFKPLAIEVVLFCNLCVYQRLVTFWLRSA